jgi:predicted Zn-dependent peptidase
MRSSPLALPTWWAAALLAGVPSVLAAQKELPPAAGAPRDFRVPPHETITLANGMRVTFVRYGALPKVVITLQVATGGIDERASQVQLAGLTADMLLEGTRTRTASDISRAAADMGGSIGAFASDDATTIGGEVLSEFGPSYITLLGDVVRNPRVAQADVERLVTNRIRNNAIALSQPTQITRVRFREAIFGDHPYARVYAPEAMLRTYSADTVRAFHARSYGARRAHLYVSGVFDRAAMEKAIRAAFGSWPSGPARTVNPPTPATTRQFLLNDRPDAVQSSLRVGLPVPGPASPDWIKLTVTDALLGGAFGSRITSNLREDKGYTYSPFSFLGSWPRTGLWLQVADVTTNVTGPSVKEIFYEVNRLRNEPPSQAELNGILNYLAGIFTIQNSTRSGVVNQLQFVDEHGLGEAYLTGYVRNVLSVTPGDVQQAAQRYLDPDRMSITITGDRKQVEEQVAPWRPSVP